MYKVRSLASLAVTLVLSAAFLAAIDRPDQPAMGVPASSPTSGSGAEGARLRLEVPVTASDVRKSPANNSPVVAADPTDGRFVVTANRLDAPNFGCGLAVSGDRGDSWERVKPVRTLPKGADRCYAPEVAFDRNGVLFYLFIGLQGQGNEPMGAFLTTSKDRARSFSAPKRVLGPERYMVRMAIDPKRARIYLAWLQAGSDPPLGGLPPPPNPLMSAFSDDGGKSFSKPVRVNDPRRRLAVAPALTVAPDGTVHVAYYDLQDDLRDYQGLEGPTWEGRWSLALASSSDGGRSFRHSEIDEEISPPERVMLIFTMPPPSLAAGRSGRLYAAWPDALHGDPDILFRRSADGGRSWDDAVRLNDDPAGNGRMQHLPRLAVSAAGRLDAIFYDRRNDPQNLRNDVYFASSRNGGEHFSPNLRLTSESSDSRVGQQYPLIPSARDRYEFGARLGLLSTSSSALAAWTDTRNSLAGEKNQDIFARKVIFESR